MVWRGRRGGDYGNELIAMVSAFQSNAFQNNAFQIDAVSSSTGSTAVTPPSTGPGPPSQIGGIIHGRRFGGVSPWTKRRHDAFQLKLADEAQLTRLERASLAVSLAKADHDFNKLKLAQQELAAAKAERLNEERSAEYVQKLWDDYWSKH
jgi:hypothetical protein